MVLVYEIFDIFFKEAYSLYFLDIICDVLRNLFSVFLIEIRDQKPYYLCRLISYVFFLVEEQLLEHVHYESLLQLARIYIVFFKGAEVFSEFFPVFFAAQVNKHLIEGFCRGEPVEYVYIVLYGLVFEALCYPAAICEAQVRPCHLLVSLSLLKAFVCKRCIYAVFDHEVFEIPELCVYFSVSALLGFVHIVQLVEDYLKGFRKWIYVHGAVSVFYPEV